MDALFDERLEHEDSDPKRINKLQVMSVDNLQPSNQKEIIHISNRKN